MRIIRVIAVSLLIILILCCSGFAESGALARPEAEYMIAVIDLSMPSEVSANLFYAFSIDSFQQTPSRITFWDLPPENVTNLKVNDYLFFEPRYIAGYEKNFIDDDTARFYNDKQAEEIGVLAIYLFQEPFWSMHLAFRLPTALLEWQLKLKEKYTGHDMWPQAFSAIDNKLPDGIQFEKITLPQKSGFNISYILPQKVEKLTTRGVMLEYRERLQKGQDALKAVEKILNAGVYYASTGEKMRFPVARFYIKTKPGLDGVFLESSKGDEMELGSLVRRIGARESGSYYNRSGLVLNNLLLERLVVYSNPPSDNLPVRAKTMSLMKENDFHTPTNLTSRIDAAWHTLRFLIIGLVSWIIFFLVSHYQIVRGLRLSKSIGLAVGAYFIYLLVSSIFLFMYGFGFLLGVIGMESMIHRTPNGANFPAWKLFSYGLATSVLTAIVVYFACV